MGRQTSVVQGSITTALYYNLSGHLLSEAYSGGPLNGLRVTNIFDQFNRRTNLLVYNGTTLVSSTAYSYDAASRLATVSDGNGNKASYSYLAKSSLIGQITFTNGSALRMTTTKNWDYLNRLTSISSVSSGSSVANFSYTYNQANERTRDTLADGSYWRYGYDPLGQVISGHKYWSDQSPVAGHNFDYTFDDIGNRTQTKAGGDQQGWNQRVANYSANVLNQYTSRDVPPFADIMGVSFATNAVTVNGQTAYRKNEYFREQLPINNSSSAVWSNITVAANGQSSVTGHVFLAKEPESFVYDLDGNLSTDGRWSYTWDGENRLVQMVANTTTGPQQLIAFTYDWQGRRIRKQVWSNTSGSGSPALDLTFVYDGWNLVAELNTGTPGTMLRSYVWGSDLSGSIQGAGGVGGLLEMSYYGAQTTNSFIAYDGNGNVAALINAVNGQPVATYEYGPFGEVLRVTGPMAKLNPFTFQTEFYDWETDKISWMNRYYDWSPGRWLSRDPANEPGFNLLASVNSGKFKQDTDEEQEVGSDDSDNGATVDTATAQTPDLLYVFVQNNPENLTDDLGLTVYLQAHHVPLGLGFNHSKVTVVVGCESRWWGQYPFVHPMPGEPGAYYGTIGAGPVHHKLTKGLNRKWDIRLQRNVFSTTISPPGGLSEDDFIGALLDANAQYKDDLPYVLFPTRKGKGYNSNGYASGILLYVIGSMPPRPPHTPGFNKPVPGSEF